MARINVSSGALWEDIVGYSRAVVLNNIIYFSGTTAIGENGEVVGEDVYTQTKFILNKIKNILEDHNSSLENVYRTRMFTTDISKWEDIGNAHGEFFSHIKPATTLVEISRLIDDKLLIEIEIEAIIDI